MRLGQKAGSTRRRATKLGLVAVVVGLAGGCDDTPISPAGDAGAGALPSAAYTIAVLPDTPYYSSSGPDIFLAQTRWLVQTRAGQQIAVVLHTVDLVRGART